MGELVSDLVVFPFVYVFILAYFSLGRKKERKKDRYASVGWVMNFLVIFLFFVFFCALMWISGRVMDGCCGD